MTDIPTEKVEFPEIPHILVTEDEPEIAEVNCAMVKGWGYKAEFALNVEDSVRKVRERRWHFGLLDISLRDRAYGGIEIAKEMMKVGIPFIYLTAFENDSDIRQAVAATNPVTMIGKPYDGLVLKEILNQQIPPPTFDEWLAAYQTNDRTTAYCQLFDEIISREPEDAWIERLIPLAEDAQFETEQDRRLAPKLHQTVMALRDCEDRDTSDVVRAAIRLYASIIRSDEIESMVDFLEAGHGVDCLLTTLTSLSRHFIAQPPSTIDAYNTLANKVADIATAYLHPQVLRVGPNSAIALGTLKALAAMGSSQGRAIVDRVPSGWFAEMVEHEVRELRNTWAGRGIQDPISLLDDSLCRLQSRSQSKFEGGV